MIRKVFPILGLFLLFFGLLPPATSLYRITGEERLAAQVSGLLHWAHTAVRPQPRLAPDDVVPIAEKPPYGINTFLTDEVLPEVRAESLRLIRSAGFHYVRQEFVWEDIEIAGKGDFIDRRNDVDGDGQIDAIDAWAKYDNIVALTEQYGLELIVRLGNPPAWSRAGGNEVGQFAPPDDFADYADFVAAVVERYEGRIRFFQLWNEPNIYPEWGEQNVDPEAYTDLLCRAAARAREANPEVVIIAAALSPTINMDGRNMNDLVFLQRMYDAGAAGCFDILAAQGYGLFSGPTDRRLRPVVINYPHNLLLRDVMVRNGDAEKPLWISEMGWNTVPEGMPTPFGQVSEEQQSRYAVEAYQRAQREWPWVGVVNYWFFKRAADFERGEPFYYFRMFEPDFTPLPVYDGLREYLPEAGESGVQPRGAWFFIWQSLRPLLALSGGGLLFFGLLRRWTPPEPEPDA